jgi:hypothetical protein
MASSIKPIPGSPRVTDTATVLRAVADQTKATGAAGHSGVHEAVHAEQRREARRRDVDKLIGKKGTAATLAALTLLPDMGRRRRDNDDAEPRSGGPRGEQPADEEGLNR